MAYAAAILTMRGKDELLVVIWGGVYCPVDFLLLLETDHFIPELCPFLVLPPTLLFLLGYFQMQLCIAFIFFDACQSTCCYGEFDCRGNICR